MNETIFDGGGPAYPHSEVVHNGAYGVHNPKSGMTVWDVFAAAALQGMIASDTESLTPIEKYAELAGLTADDMLAERRKRFSKQETTE